MYETDKPLDQLVHLYIDGAFSRRELVRRAARYTGSVTAAITTLAAIPEVRAQGQPCPADLRIPEDSTIIDARDVTFPSENGTMLMGYIARPKNQTEAAPGVICLHENRGLVSHHRDVVRRMARDGFVAVSVDLISRDGGAAAITDPQAQSQAYGRTTQEQRRLDIIGTLSYLKSQPMVMHDRIGITGFCAGGGNIWDFICNVDELAAAVPFYGAPAPLEWLPNIKTPVLAIYAEEDRALTMRLLPVANEMLRLQKRFGMIIYPGTRHAFLNDTGAAFHAAAACNAWTQMIDFFNLYLRAPRA